MQHNFIIVSGFCGAECELILQEAACWGRGRWIFGL